jgi:hypothetical protein
MISPVPKLVPLKNNYFSKPEQKKKTKKKISIPKQQIKGTIDVYA